MDLSVAIGAKKLANPVGVASGTFGYGGEYEQLVDFSAIGALYTKAVTLAPRPGNDIPRIVETPSGLLNSIGLANVGVDRFISEKMPYSEGPAVRGGREYRRVHGRRVRRRCSKNWKGAPGIWGYEINVSCPNVKHGGMAFGTDPAQVERLTAGLRKRTKNPLIVKLTPNVTDIRSIAKAAQEGGADAVSCINTLVGMVIDTAAKKARAALGHGRTFGSGNPARGRCRDLRGEQGGEHPRDRHGRHHLRKRRPAISSCRRVRSPDRHGQFRGPFHGVECACRHPRITVKKKKFPALEDLHRFIP